MRAWTAIEGAAKWTAAMVRGDRATPREAGNRAAICAACPSAKRYRHKHTIAVFCGRAFKNTKTTCGCLVGHGDPMEPAGKVCVQSEKCPQRKW